MRRTMSMRAKTVISYTFLMIAVFICSAACMTFYKKSKDPFFESFYEKSRLIMTDEEKKIYRSLLDTASRRKFIEEFWKIRDPDPSTEENENRLEFENWKTFAGKSMGSGKEKDRGWRSSRGRVYIILGPPSMANYGMGWGPLRLYNDNKNSSEIWYYRRYDLLVIFQKRIPAYWRQDHSGDKDRGEPYLRDWDYELLGSTDLLYAMDDSKLNLINNDYVRRLYLGG